MNNFHLVTVANAETEKYVFVEIVILMWFVSKKNTNIHLKWKKNRFERRLPTIRI